jgi:hypothetical protein
MIAFNGLGKGFVYLFYIFMSKQIPAWLIFCGYPEIYRQLMAA